MSEERIGTRAVYDAALATHAHYDNLSIAIVTGMIGVSGAAVAISNAGYPPLAQSAVLWVTVVVVWLLLRIYNNCATAAVTARNYAAALESSPPNRPKPGMPFGVSGLLVSTYAKSIDWEKIEKEPKRLEPRTGHGMGTGTRTVTILAWLLMAALACMGFFHSAGMLRRPDVTVSPSISEPACSQSAAEECTR